jgi:beta-glucanase (GH16 family)
MLRLRGSPVRGFALADASAFARAQQDLDNQVLLVVGAGDAYYNAHKAAATIDYSDAVASYQAAGQAGATSVGPEIDGAGAAGVTQPLTHQAWVLNGQLAALTKSGQPSGSAIVYYTQTDADRARALVVQMAALYQQAITAGSSASSPSTTSSSSSAPWIAIGIATALAAAVVVSTRRSHAYA